MLLALKSNEGITVWCINTYNISFWKHLPHRALSTFQAHLEEDKTFVLLDDDDEDDNEEKDVDVDFLDEETETEIHDITG